MGDVAILPRKTIAKAFEGNHPFHQMLGDALEQLGGLDFIVDWAEEHPTEFMRVMLLIAPPPQAHATGSGGMHLHLHQDLVPGELDGKLVGEQ